MKNMLKPELREYVKQAPCWQNNFVFFSFDTETWEEQLKSTLYNNEKVVESEKTAKWQYKYNYIL